MPVDLHDGHDELRGGGEEGFVRREGLLHRELAFDDLDAFFAAVEQRDRPELRGKPVIVMHGAATGRRLPPALVIALHARGYRPLVPQRPGYGLTDVADGPYLQQGAEDMARVMDSLRIDRAKLLLRDSSTPTGLLFASLYADRVIAGTDCGFATSRAGDELHPDVAWAKLQALVDGARIATKRLWN